MEVCMVGINLETLTCFFKKKLKVFRYFVIEYHLISYVCLSVCLLVFVFGSKPTNHRSQTLTF